MPILKLLVSKTRYRNNEINVILLEASKVKTILAAKGDQVHPTNQELLTQVLK
jgi:hypothetical protein